MTVHVPILVKPIVEALKEPFEKTSEPHYLVDCTLGGGGHTQAFLEALPKHHKVLSLDQDADAIQRAQQRFATELKDGRLELRHTRFSEAQLPPNTLGVIADLGFSSDQLEDAERGLSFMKEGPLDMRLDPTRGRSALEYLRNVNERDLAHALEEYGEERFSKRIASTVIQARRDKQLPRTTKELADLIVRTVPPPARHGRIHAATRTFQALRIVVNEELEELDRLLERVILSVKPGGRVAVLSFHSLEDRKVKNAFKDREKFAALTKKPIEADDAETASNPRARSAKLRIAERT